MSSNQQLRLLITKTLVANSDDVRPPINLVDAVSRASESKWDFSQMLDGYWWTLETTQDGRYQLRHGLGQACSKEKTEARAVVSKDPSRFAMGCINLVTRCMSLHPFQARKSTINGTSA